MTICGISLRRLTMVGVVALCAAAATASSGFAGGAATCIAKDGHATYKGGGNALQQAFDASLDGDTIQISGTCTGNFGIHTSITVEGKTRRAGDGMSGGGSGQVLVVNAGST